MIKAKDLTYDYGSFRAADRVYFDLEIGEALGFLGPNGAGKSTTMKMLTGFLRPTLGTASINGYDIVEDPIKAKKCFGYLPENGPLYPEMTVAEFLDFVAQVRELKGREASRAIGRVMDLCHLDEVRQQPIETLSKGFRQRVGMAQAILHDPPCLILDEPTDGLDPNQKQEMRRLIADMAEEKAIIISTHILEEVDAVCSRVIIINHGKVLVDETPETLRRCHPLSHAVRLTLGEVDQGIQAVIEGLEGVKEVSGKGESWLIVPEKQDGTAPLQARLWEAAKEHDWPIVGLQPEPVKMEAIFSQLTQGR